MATNGLLNKIKEALTSTQPHTAVCRLDAQKEPPKKEKKEKRTSPFRKSGWAGLSPSSGLKFRELSDGPFDSPAQRLEST